MVFAGPASMIAVSTILPILAIGAVALRFYTRHLQKAPLLLDDWFILPSLVLCIATGVCIITGVAAGGIGKPTPSSIDPIEAMSRVTPEQVIAGKVESAIIFMAPPALGFAKLSIVYFYRRIFCSSQRKSRFSVVSASVNTLVAAWMLGFFLMYVFDCGSNVTIQWGPMAARSTKCVNNLQVQNSFAISDALLDIIILCLPLYLIWDLHMSTKKKFEVTGVLLMGAGATVVSILKMAVVITVVYNIPSPFASTDMNLALARVLFFCMLELGLIIIAACLPALKSLVGTAKYSTLWRNSVEIIGKSWPSSSTSSGPGRFKNLEDTTASSNTRFTRKSLTTTESHAMRDLEAQEDAVDIPKNQIVVSSTFTCRNSLIEPVHM